MSRAALDPYLVDRLLAERGAEPLGGSTVRDHWAAAGSSDEDRRRILLTQLESLHIRRGVVGRYFDADRVLLQWQPGSMHAPHVAPGLSDPYGTLVTRDGGNC